MSDITYVSLGTPSRTYVSIVSELVQVIRATNPIYITTEGKTGPQGIQGEQGDSTTWQVLTQAEYDAITPDPNVLYVIIN